VAKGVRSYRDLLVWQKGMDLAAEVYRLSRGWPKEEIYGLTSQARRAAASIPANIAEGYGRQSTASYGQFLKIARGSLKELETHLLLAERVGLVAEGTCADALSMADELGKMLGALIMSLSKSSARQ
jgi:four helix bundle protein